MLKKKGIVSRKRSISTIYQHSEKWFSGKCLFLKENIFLRTNTGQAVLTILGEFEVTMSKPWKMDRKQTQNHSSPGLLFSYIGDFPGLPFFHQCLMGSLFAFMFSWSFNLRNGCFWQGSVSITPFVSSFQCVCASFSPEVVGRKHLDMNAYRVNTKRLGNRGFQRLCETPSVDSARTRTPWNNSVPQRVYAN